MDSHSGRRVLLVEDERQLHELVTQFLRIFGFEVVGARDGLEAIRIFDDHQPFDLAMIDLILPGCSGIEICRHILESHPAQRLLVCSAVIEGENEQILKGIGVQHFLSKPYPPESLIQVIAQTMELPIESFTRKSFPERSQATSNQHQPFSARW